MAIFILCGVVALFCCWLLILSGLPGWGIIVAGLIGFTSGFLAAHDEGKS